MKNIQITPEQARTMVQSATYIDKANSNRRVTASDVDRALSFGGYLFISPQIPDQIRYFVQGSGSAPLGWLQTENIVMRPKDAKEVIHLWRFPESDLAAWQSLTGDHLTYADYLRTINSIQADQERQGRRVKIITPTVAEFSRELERRELENTQANRAYLISTWQ